MRLIYDELRKAGQPLTTRELAERIMRIKTAAAGDGDKRRLSLAWNGGDDRAAAGCEASVACLSPASMRSRASVAHILASLFSRPTPAASLILRFRDVQRFRMSPSALPLISKQDYPIFQQIIPELRQTEYEEWLEDHAKSIAYRRSRNGSVEVPVPPDEFDSWLKETDQATHLELLWLFAESKAERLSRTADTSNDEDAP